MLLRLSKIWKMSAEEETRDLFMVNIGDIISLDELMFVAVLATIYIK